MVPATRGTRTFPTTMSRDGLRRSIAVPNAGASARGTKSTGTNHARPSRAGGAGSEISRPPTDARLWPGVSTIVWVRAVTVSPPASVVFANRELEELLEVVEREHLLATDESGGERATSLGG